MTVKLSQPDFQRLSKIVSNLPDFANVRDRRRLVAGALEGVPLADIMLARLDLDGMPMAVAVEVVRFFSHFGQVAVTERSRRMITFTKNKEEPWCGAVPGSTILDSAVPRPATTTVGRGAAASASMLVYVLSARSGELFSRPLYFTSFTLYTNFIHNVE